MQTDQVMIPDSDTFENDLLDRANFVRNLKAILIGGDKGIVLGLNGAWGTGKSTTVNFLQKELIDSGHVVIVLNAWADDYITDPLISIIASLVADENFKSVITNKNLVSRLTEIGKNVIGLAASLGVSRLTRGQLSPDELTRIFEVKTDYSEILNHYIEEKNSLTELRNILEEVSENLQNNEGKKLIIIVDELDRCKPTYAVALFERIKHILEIENLRVLLSFDQNQLEATMKKHYGSSIDSNRYLEKMFDIIINLPSANLAKLLKKTAKTLELSSFRIPELERGGDNSVDEFLGMLLTLLNAMNASARELERTLTRIKFLLSRENGLHVDSVFAVVLLILKNQNPDLFQKIKNETSTFDEIDKIFNKNPTKSRYWNGSFANYVETLYYIKQDSKLDKDDLTSMSIESQAYQELPDQIKLKRQRMQSYINPIREDRFGSLSEMANAVDFIIQ